MNNYNWILKSIKSKSIRKKILKIYLLFWINYDIILT